MVVSLSAAFLIARSASGYPLLLLPLVALAGVTLMLNVAPQTLFLGWLLAAPIFQNAALESSVGAAGVWAFYIAPAVLLGALTLARRERVIAPNWIDVFPGAYVLLVVVSTLLATSAFQADPLGVSRQWFLATAVGPVVYYFLVFGPGCRIPFAPILRVLMIGAILQSFLAVVDLMTGWNPWGYDEWKDTAKVELVGPDRAIATLANPGVLGAFIGVAVVSGVGVHAFDGPRSLRRLSSITIACGSVGLLATLTRGPILATFLAVIGVLFLSRLRIMAVGILLAGAIAVFALLPTVQSSAVYQQRVIESKNILGRKNLQDWSLRLASEKPLLGWGYGSFDEAKNNSGYAAKGISVRSVLDYTSHNTYLTVLVELGVLGLIVLLLPAVVISLRSFKRALDDPSVRCVVAGGTGSLAVVFLTASTLDYRFFSLAQMLPWLFLGVMRQLPASGGAHG